MQSFLGIAEEECGEASRDVSPSEPEPLNNIENLVVGKPVTAEEYFSNTDLCGRDIGRPRKMNEKVRIKYRSALNIHTELKTISDSTF